MTSVGHIQPIGVGTDNWKDVHEEIIGNPLYAHHHNDRVDICAPGYNVTTTTDNNGYGGAWGTSFASPMIAGVCGLILSVSPCLEPSDVEFILKSTAVNIDAITQNVPYAGLLGAGRANAYEAVLLATTYGNVPTITSNTTWTGDRFVKGTVTVASGTLTINGTVRMAKDAKIVVNSGATLNVSGGVITSSSGCSEMWDGIVVNNNGRVYVQGASIIEDAEVGVDIKYGAYYYLNNSTFNRNYVHVQKSMPSSGTPTLTADYRISKCKFLCHDIPNVSGAYSTLLPPHAGERTSVGVLATGVPKILVGNTLANANTFENSDYGVFAWTVKRVDVRYNTILDMTYGGAYAAYGPGLGGETINISNNTMQRIPFPILCHDNTKTVRTHINYNIIDFAGMTTPPVTMVGITVSEVTPATGDSPTDNFNYVDVSHNTISNAPCGINLENLRGDLLSGGVAKLYVGDNTITHAKNSSFGNGSGIKTNNVSQVAISNNIINSPPLGVTNWWENAIRISGGNEIAVTCNQTFTLGQGLFFDNDIRPLSVLALNQMTGHGAGIFLNYSKIGDQGTMADPNDNRWLGSWTGKNHIESYGNTSVGLDSKFTTQSAATYIPTTRFASLGATAVPYPTISTDTWSFGCQFVNPSFKLDGEVESPATEALGMIGESEQPINEREAAMRWNGHYGLYKQLLRDEQLVNADESITAFFADRNEGNIGKLHRVLDLFGQLRQGNGDAALAEAELGSVFPENRPEQTLKEVLDVLMPNAADLRRMSSEQEELLREVALRCPIDDGFGVYIARSALLSLDTLPKNYVSECERVPSPDDVKEKQNLQNATSPEFSAFPNPNNGQMTLNYTLHEGEVGMIEVFDLIGHKVFSQPLSGESSTTNIALTNIRSGAYLLRVEVNGQSVLTEKISIVRN